MRWLSYLFLICITPILALSECRFGLLIPQTGEYAALGQDCYDGFQTAEKRKINLEKNLKIKFVIEDSRGLGKDSVSMFRKLAEVDQVSAVQLIRSPVGMAVNPLSKQSGVPILGAVGHTDFLSENPLAFQYWPSVAQESKVLADLAWKENIRTIYSIATDDDWLLGMQKGFEANFQELGGKIVGHQTMEASFLDFRSLISRIKQTKADSIYLGVGVAQLPIAIKQIREAGLQQKLYTTFFVKNEDVIKGLPKSLLEKITFVEIDSIQPNFTASYQKIASGRMPSAASYTCYVITEALYQACELQQKTKQTMLETLSNLKKIQTLDYDIDIIDRLAQFKVIAREFRQGEIITLKE